MTWADFYMNIFLKDYYTLGILFIVILSINLLVFRKNIFSLFDPLNILCINLSSCLTIIIYLKIINNINEEYFYQLILINITFFISLKLFLIKQNNLIKNKIKNFSYFKLFYTIHLYLFFITIFLYIKFVGLKAFNYKLIAFNNVGIINYLRRIVFPGQLILILIKRELYKNNRSKIDFLYIIIIFVMFIISGDKVSSILFFLYFSYVYYMLNEFNIGIKFIKYKKNEKKLFIFSMVFVFFIFAIKPNNGVLKSFLFRLISTGDVYYMVYPNNNIDKLNIINLFQYYILSLAAPISNRIVQLPSPSLGFDIVSYLYNINSPHFGPNSRYDVISQMNIGYFGIIFSIISAYLISYFRKVKTLNFINIYISCILFVQSESIITDFTYFAKFIFGLLIVVLPIFILTEFFHILKYKKIKMCYIRRK
jgi:hypothetical protein